MEQMRQTNDLSFFDKLFVKKASTISAFKKEDEEEVLANPFFQSQYILHLDVDDLPFHFDFLETSDYVC